MAGSSSDSGDNGRLPSAVAGLSRYVPYVAATFTAVFFVWAVFYGKGGLDPSTNTTIWIVTVALSATAIAASIVAKGTQSLYGWAALAAFALYTVFVAASITWSLIPSATWLEFNRTVAYLSIFAAGIAVARLCAKSWLPIITATAVAVSVIVVYALLTKVAPAWLAPDETYARLRAPFNYWNATGMFAAFGVVLSLWLGTERSAHRLIRAAAYPLMGLSLVALLLSYSRGSLLVALVGVALWFLLVAPRRLSGIPVFAAAAVAVTPVVAWIFGNAALTDDNVSLAIRKQAGIEMGIALLATVAVLYGVALLMQWLETNRPLSPRAKTRVGRSSLAIVAMVPVAIVIALAASEKGLVGTVESGWDSLTSEEATTPANSPSRFGSTASVRSRYWREAVEIWRDHYYKGSGAGSYEILRKRYRKSPVSVVHAHGQIPQALADLGLAGALLIALSGAAWVITAYRTLSPRKSAKLQRWDTDRYAITAMAILVLMFGLHAAIDWTWYVPGIVLPVLLLAGWVAGRGPIERPVPQPESLGRQMLAVRIAAAALVLALAGVSIWSAVQPQRASNKVDGSLEFADEKKYDQAAAEARSAHRINPTSVEPYFALSSVERSSGNIIGGFGPLEQAVRLQPANPVAWKRLGSYYLFDLGNTSTALSVLQRAVFLDPQDAGTSQLFVKAERALEAKRLQKLQEEKLKRRRARMRKQARKRLASTTQPAPTQPEQVTQPSVTQ